MNKYLEMKERHQKEVNEFPMFFAFNNEQFNEGMEKAGLKSTDTDKIHSLKGTGGFYKKTDSVPLGNMFNKHEAERKKAINEDTTGDGYIYEMFRYELSNHEYIVTSDLTDTLSALGITIKEINANPQLLHGLHKAKEDYLKNVN